MLKIFCVHCKKHIYNYACDAINHCESFLVDFIKPANKDIKQPQIGEDMRCPLCNKLFNSKKGILTDKGFLPK